MKYHIAVCNKIIASFQAKEDRDQCYIMLIQIGTGDYYKVDDVPVQHEAQPCNGLKEAEESTEGGCRVCAVRRDGDFYVFKYKGKDRPVTLAPAIAGFSHYRCIDGEQTISLNYPAKYLDGVVFDEE